MPHDSGSVDNAPDSQRINASTLVVNSKISCLINIEQELKTAASQGVVVVRFRTLPDSDRWIEPQTLSDRKV